MAEGDRASVNLTMRLRPALYEELRSTAESNGRSVSAEAEARLQGSLNDGPRYPFFGDSTVAGFELLKSLSETLRKARKIAITRKFGEIETRKTLRAAYERIGAFYFWDGKTDVGPGVIGDASKPPTHTSNRRPEEIGCEVADNAMIWNDDQLLEDFGDGRLSNIWSGDGSTSEVVAARELPQTALSSILLGDNKETKPARKRSTRGQK